MIELTFDITYSGTETIDAIYRNLDNATDFTIITFPYSERSLAFQKCNCLNKASILMSKFRMDFA